MLNLALHALPSAEWSTGYHVGMAVASFCHATLYQLSSCHSRHKHQEASAAGGTAAVIQIVDTSGGDVFS